MPDLFLSYSRRDKPFVERLFNGLSDRGKDVWADFDDIPGAAAWRGELHLGITESDAFVFVISPHSVTSDYCRQEVDQAAALNKRMVPVLFEQVPAAELPAPAAAHQWISFVDRDFEQALAELVGVIDTDLEGTREHTRWLVAAQKWDERARDGSLLLRGTELGAAESWLARPKGKAPEPTPLQYELVQASRNAASRRLRLTVGAVSVALIVALGLALLALVQRNDAIDKEKLARSRELAANAALNMDGDPELSLILAAEAARIKATPQAEQTLREALGASRIRAVVRSASPLRGAAFSRDGGLAIAAGTGSALIFDGTDGKVLERVPTGPKLSDAAVISRDGRHVASGGDDGKVTLWDPRGGGRLHVLPAHRDFVTGLAFSPDGRTLASASADGTARLWDVRSGDRVGRVMRAGALISDVSFSPDGGSLVTAGARASRLWTARGAPGPLLIGARRGTELADFSPDGRLVMATSVDGAVRQWGRAGGRPRHLLSDAKIHAAAFSPDARRVVTGNTLGDAKVTYLSGEGSRQLVGHGTNVEAADFSPDGTLVVTGSGDHSGRVWDAGSGKSVAVLRGHSGLVDDARFSPDGARIVTASADRTARLWEAFDLPVARKLALPANNLADTLAFDRSGRRVLVDEAGTSPDGHLRAKVSGRTLAVSDSSGRTVAQITSPGADFTAFSFSPDSRQLATGSARGGVTLWKARGGGRVSQLGRHEDAEVTGVSFRDDGRQVISAAQDDSARVWSVEKRGAGPADAMLEPIGAAGHVAISPDGRFALTGGPEGRGFLWNVATRHRIAELPHSAPIGTTAFSPNSAVAITAGQDGSTRVWDAETGRKLATVQGTAAAISADGRKLAAAGIGDARLYECEVCGGLDDLLAAAGHGITRRLSAAERDEFLH